MVRLHGDRGCVSAYFPSIELLELNPALSFWGSLSCSRLFFSVFFQNPFIKYHLQTDACVRLVVIYGAIKAHKPARVINCNVCAVLHEK